MENTETVAVVAELMNKKKGDRGIVGPGTPSVRMKSRYAKEGKLFTSLKAFARKLAKDGDKDAKNWLEFKNGMLENLAKEERWGKKGARLTAERNATKLAKRKRGKGAGGGAVAK